MQRTSREPISLDAWRATKRLRRHTQFAVYTEGEVSPEGLRIYYLGQEEIAGLVDPEQRLEALDHLWDLGFGEITFEPERLRYRMVLRRMPAA